MSLIIYERNYNSQDNNKMCKVDLMPQLILQDNNLKMKITLQFNMNMKMLSYHSKKLMLLLEIIKRKKKKIHNKII